MGDAWIKRVESIETMGFKAWPRLRHFLTNIVLMRDPMDWVHAVDGDPDLITQAARLLGPDAAHDDLCRRFEAVKEELGVGLEKLASHWTGDAADTFTEEYLRARLLPHLDELMALCKAQAEAAGAVAVTLQAAQNRVYTAIVNVIDSLVPWLTVSAAVFVILPPAAAAPLAEVELKIQEFYAALNDAYADLDAALSGHAAVLRRLPQRAFQRTGGGIGPADLDEDGWQPAMRGAAP